MVGAYPPNGDGGHAMTCLDQTPLANGLPLKGEQKMLDTWLRANRPDKFDGLACPSGGLAGDQPKPDDASTPDPMTVACFSALAKRTAEIDPDSPPDG